MQGRILAAMAGGVYRHACRPIVFPSFFQHRLELRQAVAAFLFLFSGGRFASALAQVFVAEFGDEAARLAHLPFAPAFAFLAVGQCQAALGAGDADVHQAAFFLDLVVFDAFAVRQDAFFQPDQEYVGKLQPLGGVQGGQAHRVDLGVLAVVQDVQQRDGLGQFDDVLAVFFALAGQPGGEIHHVVPLVLRWFGVFLVEQVGFVGDGLEQFLEDLAGRFALGAALEIVDEVAEDQQRLVLLGAELGF